MPEIIRSAVGVLRSLDRGFVILDLPEENTGIQKKERVLSKTGWTRWRTVRPKTPAVSIGEELIRDDLENPHDETKTFANALVRSVKTKFSVHIDNAQIMKRSFLGTVQQKRLEQNNNETELMFDAWFCNLLLHPGQIKRIEGARVLPLKEMLKYLHEHYSIFRPPALLAIVNTLKQEKLPR